MNGKDAVPRLGPAVQKRRCFSAGGPFFIRSEAGAAARSAPRPQQQCRDVQALLPVAVRAEQHKQAEPRAGGESGHRGAEAQCTFRYSRQSRQRRRSSDQPDHRGKNRLQQASAHQYASEPIFTDQIDQQIEEKITASRNPKTCSVCRTAETRMPPPPSV